ncbi:MAG: diaminopimelate epimerase [Alistipes sp.]|nr:diaminopimelate epimerase [Alistipes sp.]
MLKQKYILCHGSGNRFLMLDAVAEPRVELLAAKQQLVARLCREVGNTDGLLLTVRTADGFGMRMFNTDGSEAEMCGNGIRCVARQAQTYVGDKDAFVLYSGGRCYAIRREEPIFGSLPTYCVAIGIRLSTADFVPSLGREEGFVGETIQALDPALKFTYLNLGNPHLVAAVEEIDLELLSRLGEKVKALPELLPHGTNVSFYRPLGGQRIYTATYERGVGLTASCGTAMTACSTAACLLGYCRHDEPIEVLNSGGKVRCCSSKGDEGLETTLSGNATYEGEGELLLDFEQADYSLGAPYCEFEEERTTYERFLQTIQAEKL